MEYYWNAKSKGMKTAIATSAWNWPRNLFINLFGITQPIPDNLEISMEKAMDIALQNDEKEIMLYFYKDKLDRHIISSKVNLPVSKISVMRSVSLRKLYQNRFARYILTRGIDQTERKLAGPVLEWDISFLHMPLRFYNSMDTSKWLIGTDKNIETVEDLIQFSREEIMRARSMGEATVDLLEEKLAEHGLSLKR